MPGANLILLVIAGILATLAIRGYQQHGELRQQHKTWLTIATIFTVVSIVVTLSN